MLPEFDYYAPETLQDASKILMENPDAKIIAGGTDLLINMRAGKINPSVLIDIKKINNLNKIEVKEDYLEIGALITFNDLLINSIIKERFKLLYECAEVMGCHEVRNRATIGGNIMNASPGSEAGSPLFVLEAVVVLFNGENERKVKILDFIKGVGKTDIKKGEILTKILVPLYKNTTIKSTYFRGSRVRGMDLASMNLAMLILNPDNDLEREIRISIGAVHTTPLRVKEIEELLSRKKLSMSLLSEAKKKVKEILKPRATSLRATPEYKKILAGNFIQLGLEKLLNIKFH